MGTNFVWLIDVDGCGDIMLDRSHGFYERGGKVLPAKRKKPETDEDFGKRTKAADTLVESMRRIVPDKIVSHEVMCGSNRQDAPIDEHNESLYGNGSSMLNLELLADKLGAEYVRTILADAEYIEEETEESVRLNDTLIKLNGACYVTKKMETLKLFESILTTKKMEWRASGYSWDYDAAGKLIPKDTEQSITYREAIFDTEKKYCYEQ